MTNSMPNMWRTSRGNRFATATLAAFILSFVPALSSAAFQTTPPGANTSVSTLRIDSKIAGLIRVNTTADNLTAGDGACTLREAITNANANSDSSGGDCAPGSASTADTIEFQINGGGSVQAIPLSAQGLPDITEAVIIDGFSQGCSGGPCIELDLRNLTTANSGLTIIGSNIVVQGLIINGYSKCCGHISGIVISGTSATSNQILGSHILGNTESGVVVAGGASGNTIGSTAQGQGNLISGNSPNGITILDAASVNNTIQGNFIGTDAGGSAALPNEEDGINILDASRIVIGPGNLISGNGEAGIQIGGSAAVENEIVGNKIGTDLAGTSRLPNQQGVYLLSGTSGNTIGGKTDAKRNIISGNDDHGVNISGSSDNEVFRNFIGTTSNGSAALGNLKSGVFIVGQRNLIGSTEGGTGNIISGNGLHGVQISASTSSQNLIQGNHIGADPFGTSAIPNAGNGVHIEAGVSGNTVGGSRNILSGNGGHGVALLGNDNTVQGNIIGADISHGGNLGNGGNGVLVGGSGTGNSVRDNRIRFNSEAGVAILGGARNTISINKIDQNGGLGIDLGGDGVTANDAGDIDVGPNSLLNFVDIEQVSTTANLSLVEGSYAGAPSMSFKVEFFRTTQSDPSTFGEGEISIGSIDIVTDASGQTTFQHSVTEDLTSFFVTATVTDSQGNTSEFSNSRIGAAAQAQLIVTPPSRSVGADAGSTTFAVANGGTSTMTWSAGENCDWVSLSGTSGTDSGTITANYDQNVSSARTCDINVIANGAVGSPAVVAINQAGVTTQPVLNVTPASRAVSAAAGSTTFVVANGGTGTMPWSAAETCDWVSLSGASGTDSGTITANYDANSSTPRSCDISVSADGATNSPATVTIEQAAGQTQAVLVVAPDTRLVDAASGSVTFAVSNTGSGTMVWAATEPCAWVSLSGANGTNAGTIAATFDENTSAERTCTITVTSSGATGSPGDVTIVQSASISNLSAPPEIQVGQDVPISATVPSNSGTPVVELKYRAGGASSFKVVPMTGSGTSFAGAIPTVDVGNRGVEYFIAVRFVDGGTIRFPQTGVNVVRVDVTGNGVISTSAQPAGQEESAYRLVSLPLDRTNRSRSAVIDDILGAVDNTRWRMFALNPNQTTQESPQSIDPGRGYWLIAKDGGILHSGPGKTFATDTPFSIGLNAGWTFVGSPFAFDVPFPDQTGNGETFEVRSFNGNWVQGPSAMRPFFGYAVTNLTQTTDQLIIDPELTPSKAKARSVSDMLDNLDWSVGITASAGHAVDTDNLIGVIDGAEEGWDVLDRPEPPVIGEYVSVYFPHDDWDKPLKHYRTDVRTSTGIGATWRVRVDATVRGDVSLAFNGITDLPPDFEIWLVDDVVKSRRNLRDEPVYVVASNGNLSRDLTLIVGKGDFARKALAEATDIPTAYELDQNFPNPFNTTTTIRFGLPEPSVVSLYVYDLTGRRVSAVLRDTPMAAGFHSAIWNGREQDGRAPGSGLYVYQLRVGDRVLNGKMVLVK